MSKKERIFYISKIFLYIFSAISILLTLLPILKFNEWWIRIGDFPRVQIAFICVALAVLILGFIRPIRWFEAVLVTLLFACTSYQVYRIFPYTPIYPKQVEASKKERSKGTIKVLVANVLQENKDASKLLNLIKDVDPDVILLAETNVEWLRKVNSLKLNYPHTIDHPLENKYGIAMYSRLELIDPKVKFLVEDDIPSIHTEIRLASGEIVKFYGVHPRPPVPTESDDSTERDAELVLVGKEVSKMKKPVIVAGDLNDVAWSQTTEIFQKVSRMLDPRIGRGFYNSFHAEYFFLRMPLDHIFHTSQFRLIEMKRLDYIGSDHFPMFINLSLEETANLTQEKPLADQEEKEEADEMIKEAKEEKNEEED